MKDFKINDFLALKLEDGETNIYVNGEIFEQCKYLMVNIPIENPERFEVIESIDEAADMLGWTDEGQEGIEYDIDTETEFWGHCSNLQAWYEHDYDTRLLHSYLAFPLLKKLTDVKDPLAMRVFKGEIVKRLESGYPTVIELIIQEGYLEYFNRAELSDMLKVIDTIAYHKYGIFSSLLERAFEEGWIDENFISFFECIDILPSEDKYKAFAWLLEIAIMKGWIEDHFLSFLETIAELPHNKRFNALMRLRKIALEAHLMGTFFPVFLETIDELSSGDRYRAISIFKGEIVKRLESGYSYSNKKENSIFIKYYSQIQKLFVNLLDDSHNHVTFSFLINIFKDTELIQRYMSHIESLFHSNIENIDALPDYKKFNAFSVLIKAAEEGGLMKKLLFVLLGVFPKLPDIDKLSEINKQNAYSDLIKAIKGTELEKENAFKEWKEKNKIKFTSGYLPDIHYLIINEHIKPNEVKSFLENLEKIWGIADFFKDSKYLKTKFIRNNLNVIVERINEKGLKELFENFLPYTRPRGGEFMPHTWETFIIANNFLNELSSAELTELLENDDLNFLPKIIQIVESYKNEDIYFQEYIYDIIIKKSPTSVRESILRIVDNDEFHDLFEEFKSIFYSYKLDSKKDNIILISYHDRLSLKLVSGELQYNVIGNSFPLDGIDYLAFWNILRNMFSDSPSAVKKFIFKIFSVKDLDTIASFYSSGILSYCLIRLNFDESRIEVTEDFEKLIQDSNFYFFENLGRIINQEKYIVVLNDWDELINNLHYFFEKFEGDKRQVIKNEVLKRLKENNYFELSLIISAGLLNYFTKDELNNLSTNLKLKIIEHLFIAFSKNFNYQLKEYLEYFEGVEKELYHKALFEAFKSASDTDLIKLIKMPYFEEGEEVGYCYDKFINLDLQNLFTESESNLPQNLIKVLQRRFEESYSLEFLEYCCKKIGKKRIFQIFKVLPDYKVEIIIDNLIRYTTRRRNEFVIDMLDTLSQQINKEVDFVP